MYENSLAQTLTRTKVWILQAESLETLGKVLLGCGPCNAETGSQDARGQHPMCLYSGQMLHGQAEQG